MCCIWGSVFRSFTSVPLGGRGCWYWPFTPGMPDELTQKLFLPPVSLPLLHKRRVSEQKWHSWFLSRVFILPKVGPVVTMEYIQAAPTPPQTGICMDVARKNLHFHQVFFPLHSSFVLLAFIDSAAVAPVQFISSQRACCRYPYQQRMLSEMPRGVFPR